MLPMLEGEQLQIIIQQYFVNKATKNILTSGQLHTDMKSINNHQLGMTLVQQTDALHSYNKFKIAQET